MRLFETAMRRCAPVVIGAVLLLASPASRAQCSTPVPVTAESCQAAKQYHIQNGGVSLLVWVDGQPVCEDYRPGSGPTVAHELWSCTKSFSSMIAAAAIEDGLISSWDERLVDTIPEWQSDLRKSQVTLRQLLSLTSGIRAENGTPTYADALNEPALNDPGTFWEYGSVPYQIFGEFMRRKLQPDYVDPLAYLEARILDPIEADYAGWTRGSDAMPHLPWGSQWTPREYINYGELVRLGGFWPAANRQLVAQELLDEAFHHSPIKNDYGLTWWLPVPASTAKPCDAVMAFGLGSQKLYVIRSLRLVAVRQTDDPIDGLFFSDDVFLDRLIAPSNWQDDCAPTAATQLTLTRQGNDLAFDWTAVNRDANGKNELIGGYDVYSATTPSFADQVLVVTTRGPHSAAVGLNEALTPGTLLYYQVRARDKCGNAGP
jgi:CubicO group peptidase (beta-lactamase class C family)